LGVGVLAVHHTGKDGKMRGNTSLFGACDSVLFLRRDQQDITVYNSLDMGGKNKNNQEADPLRLTLLPQQVEVEGKTFDSAILVDSYQVIADEQTAQLKAREYTLLEVIEPYENGLKVEAICDATNIPRASAYRTLSTLKKNGLLVEMNEKYSLTDEGRNALSDR
jgi:predicted transcriptional regulator